MRLLPFVAVGTAVALALGGAAYAATRDDDEPPLPVPDDDATCSTASDVSSATSEILSDSSVNAQGLRAAAEVLRNWTTFCDDAAKAAGQASIKLLEAKADMLDAPSPPAGNPPSGTWWPVPPGAQGSHKVEGLHGETGTVYWYANGDEWFFPDNPLLIPYYLPGGGLHIGTQGCADCGDE